MSTLSVAVEAAIDAVINPSAYALALAELARETVREIDSPGEKTNVVSALNSLGVTLEKLAKEAHVVDDDGEADWAGIAAQAGATPIRYEAGSKSGDAGRRGRRSS